MTFNTVQEAFNHYRNSSLEDIETRAGEIKGTIENDPDADVTKLNVEIEGLNQAKANIQDKENNEGKGDGNVQQRSYNPITGGQIRGQLELNKDTIFESNEYRSAFFKTMLGQDLSNLEQSAFNIAQEVEQRAEGFASSSNSSAVLPEQTLNEVISKARTQGGLISHVRNFNIPTKVRIPIGTPTAKGQWHQEGQEVQAEHPDTVSIQFEGNEIIKVFSISVKAQTMSIAAFEQYLVQELTQAVVETIDYALVNGTGTDQGQGILTGITWDTSNTVELTGAYTDFTKALALMQRGYNAGAKFAMSNATLYNTVYGVIDANQRPIFIQDAQNESVGYIFGKEVILDDHIEDGTILLGNFQYAGFNLPQGIALEKSTESSFRSGLIDFRAMAIADCKPLVDEAFVKLAAATPEV
ncbi:MAG: phage major capsid protein [Staphylococcus equorum]|uniref:phage major capsid protein n=1 Tax=Staphylococcus TaxID=1279 RepID=UPI002555E0A9|nr:phage major capsid protein [Staphylococcus equorum]MDK9872001.1 phage major capsid protein [Staphylococcus equorum]MDK9876890.1 phage major capsid protein [Staphylococcus equorum]MDN6571664.1 phage major capsid protein [Staphylococcus equorum]MDN6611519.1 phage major capsid protein [Staphylococcus equorum]MDN6721117.1 phage major capsid protein [Staphylococcus equorum]